MAAALTGFGSEYGVNIVGGMQTFADRLPEGHRVYIPTLQRPKGQIDFVVWRVDHVGI
jgi:hypothetical protein